MKKRFLSALLCLALLMTLLPATALAAITGTFTMDFTSRFRQAWAGGKKPATEDCGGDGWSWVVSSRTLTLSGFSLTTTAAIAMRLPNDAKLVLQSGTDNTVSSIYSGAESSYGIEAIGDLSVDGGGGSLAIRSGGGEYSYGIYTRNSLTVNNGVLRSTGGSAQSGSAGVWAYGAISVTGTGALTGTGGSATNDNGQSIGVVANDPISVTGTGVLTGTGGGNADASRISFGISPGGVFTIQGGNVTAKGYSRALYHSPMLTDVTAVGSPSYDGSGEVLYVDTNNNTYKHFRASASLPTVTAVTVSPATVRTAMGETQPFTAAVTGTDNPPQDVTWSVTGNDSVATVINADGVLTVDSGETWGNILTVTATSDFDPTKSGTASVSVTADLIEIAPPALSDGKVGAAYTATLTASYFGNVFTSDIVEYLLLSGTLPPGLTLTTNADGTATLSGTPTAAGTYTFTVQAVYDDEETTGAAQL